MLNTSTSLRIIPRRRRTPCKWLHLPFVCCLFCFCLLRRHRLKPGPDEASWSRSHRNCSFCPPPPGKLQGTAIKVSPATTYWNSFPVPRPHRPGTMSTAASKFVFSNPSRARVSSACCCPSAEENGFQLKESMFVCLLTPNCHHKTRNIIHVLAEESFCVPVPPQLWENNGSSIWMMPFPYFSRDKGGGRPLQSLLETHRMSWGRSQCRVVRSH